MRKLFGLIFLFFILFTSPVAVYAQYPTAGCVCPSPAPSNCSSQAGAGPDSFPVCNHTNSNCQWACTVSGSGCPAGSWSPWSGCVNGAEGETRYCTDPFYPNDAQARLCPGATGTGPGGGVAPSPTPTPTPIPVGTILARAVEMSPTDVTCADVRAIPTTSGEVNGTSIGFTASSADQPTPKIQSGAQYVTFASQVGGFYTIDPQTPSGNWMLAASCWINDNGTKSTGFSTTLGDNETLQWDIGYTWGTSWAQTTGGDVYASGSLKSFIPNVTPRVFSKDGAGGYPGVVTYGTTYDFDGGGSGQGDTRVSSQNWIANATRSTVNYYDYFYRRYGSPTATDNDLFINLAAVEQPASRATPYYIDGDIITSGDWVVGDGESIVFIVTGNVTIGGRINITGTGFVSFIVNGNITVDSSVGTTAASTTSVLDGIYIVSPTGTFQTGLSTIASAARFVGKGMFISGNFLLQRDLDFVGANTTDAAELFIYDPQLLVTMPDTMKELPVIWQEVAP